MLICKPHVLQCTQVTWQCNACEEPARSPSTSGIVQTPRLPRLSLRPPPVTSCNLNPAVSSRSAGATQQPLHPPLPPPPSPPPQPPPPPSPPPPSPPSQPPLPPPLRQLSPAPQAPASAAVSAAAAAPADGPPPALTTPYGNLVGAGCHRRRPGPPPAARAPPAAHPSGAGPLQPPGIVTVAGDSVLDRLLQT